MDKSRCAWTFPISLFSDFRMIFFCNRYQLHMKSHAYPCTEKPGLCWLSFPWGRFHELSLTKSCQFAFHLTCSTRGSFYLLCLQNPCLRTLSIWRPKETATLSGQQARLKAHEQCVQRQFFPVCLSVGPALRCWLNFHQKGDIHKA